jgi:hypothetical protein
MQKKPKTKQAMQLASRRLHSERDGRMVKCGFPSHRHPNGNLGWDVLLWQVEGELWHGGLAEHQEPWDRNSGVHKCYHREAKNGARWHFVTKQAVMLTRSNKVKSTAYQPTL